MVCYSFAFLTHNNARPCEWFTFLVNKDGPPCEWFAFLINKDGHPYEWFAFLINKDGRLCEWFAFLVNNDEDIAKKIFDQKRKFSAGTYRNRRFLKFSKIIYSRVSYNSNHNLWQF